MIQLIHEEDVVRAMMLALTAESSGVYNVVGPGEAPLSRILEVLGRRPRSVPSLLARKILDQAWRWKASGYPPPELRHVQYNCVVDGSAFHKKMGFQPGFGLIETILSVDAHRR